PLVTRSAIAAVTINRGIRIFTAIDVVQGAKEKLSLLRSQKTQCKAAVCLAKLHLLDVGDLVAVITMNPFLCRARCLAQIVIGRIAKPQGRRVTRCANAGTVWMLRQQIPACIVLSVPIAAVVHIQEVAVAEGARVAADGPFLVN